MDPSEKRAKRYSFRQLSVILAILLFPAVGIYPQPLQINEIMAVNNTIIADEDGDYSDWIEIFNTSSHQISLEGWSLTDNRSDPRKWIFPDIIIAGNSYLVVFASEKNRREAGKELHTNFKLSSSGEYLALNDPSGNFISGFSPFYPNQLPDVSYGSYSNSLLSFVKPTPGKANEYSEGVILPPPIFSRKHGFYNSSFNLELQCPDRTAEVWYTTNGSEPGYGIGTKYTTPLTIENSSVIRAVSVKPDKTRSRVTTRTYLFTEDIIHQTNNPPGYPSLWGPYTGISGTAKADYEMDPEIISDPVMAEAVKKSLSALPAVSIVTDRGFIFSRIQDPDSGGIYIYTGPPLTNTSNGPGFDWERPASFEYFDAGDSVSLQADCILQLHGGHSRRPEKSPKHSFRLEFKSSAGPARLNYPLFGEDYVQDFNAIVLRAGFNNTWVHHSAPERTGAQYLLDIWAKDTHREMGHEASNSIFTHLFINGLYWGIYSPSEKIDADFAATYFGGEAKDYDVIKDYTEVADGNIVAWNVMMNMAKAGLSSTESYQKIQGNNPDGSRNIRISPMVDVVSLADYMIVNLYAGNTDWDHHNWIAVRNRVKPERGFTFLCWDEEKILEDVNTNILNENNPNCPSFVFQKLLQNNDFRRLFADRIHKFCTGNGPLSSEKAGDRYLEHASLLGKAIDAESARWGDYRRDVHKYQSAGPFDLYTKQNHWTPRYEYMINSYFPQRTGIFLDQLRAAGLFPSVEGPEFLLNKKLLTGKEIQKGDTLSIICERGTIYYSTDGSDPVKWVPAPVPTASAKIYTRDIVINESSHIRARVLDNGEWSAAAEISLVIPANRSDLRITEIHYHPSDMGNGTSREFEFLEIKNTGNSRLDMGGIRIEGGIGYTFKSETYIGPGKFAVLASNPDSFCVRYGFVPFGRYDGQLGNEGETVALLTPDNDTIVIVSYSNTDGWPYAADGTGNSMVPLMANPGRLQNDPAEWRASYHDGGSPGADDIFNSKLLKTGSDAGIITVFQNYPNPFTQYTYFSYKTEIEAHINISIYDINGRKVCTVESVVKPSGEYIITWDGRDNQNDYLPSGIYFYRISAEGQGKRDEITKRLVYTR